MAKYSAFVSYAREDSDTWTARVIQRAIETYRVPAELVRKGYAARLSPVFLDEDELRAGQPVYKALTEALRATSMLIVICSSNSRERPYVNDEVNAFRREHPDAPIVPVLIDGQWATSRPEALDDEPASAAAPEQWRATDSHLPIGLDLRGTRLEIRRRLRVEKLRLIAPLLGPDVRFDDLRRREQQRAIRRLSMLSGLLVIGLAGVGTLAWIAMTQRDLANRRLEASLDAANQIVFTIDRELEPLPNSATTRVAVLERAGILLSSLEGSAGEQQTRIEYIEAVVGGARADLLRLRGAGEQAREAYENAARSAVRVANETSVARHDLVAAHALIDLARSEIDSDALDQALETLTKSRTYVQSLLKEHRQTVETQRAAASLEEAYGDRYRVLGKLREAGEAYEVALKHARIVANDDNATPQAALDVATLADKLGQIAMTNGGTDRAHTLFTENLRLHEKRWKEDPLSSEVGRDYAMSMSRLALQNLGLGYLDKAEAYQREVVKLRQRLLDRSPGNLELRADLGEGLEVLSDIQFKSGKTGLALENRKLTCSVWERQQGLDPVARTPRIRLAACRDRLGDSFLERGWISQAEAAWSQAHSDLLERVRRSGSTPSARARQELGVLQEKLGEAAIRQERWGDAARWLKSCRETRSALVGGADDVSSPSTVAEWLATIDRVAELHRLQGKPERGLAVLREVEELAPKWWSEQPDAPARRLVFAVIRYRAARLLIDTDRTKEAELAAKHADSLMAPLDQYGVRPRAYRGVTLYALCLARRANDPDKAREACADALERTQAAWDSEPEQAEWARAYTEVWTTLYTLEDSNAATRLQMREALTKRLPRIRAVLGEDLGLARLIRNAKRTARL